MAQDTLRSDAVAGTRVARVTRIARVAAAEARAVAVEALVAVRAVVLAVNARPATVVIGRGRDPPDDAPADQHAQHADADQLGGAVPDEPPEPARLPLSGRARYGVPVGGQAVAFS